MRRRDRCRFSSNGAARFAGKFSLAPIADGGTHVTAKGDGDLAELVPAEYADLLSGPIALAVDADWTPRAGALPAIAVRQGSLSTANVHAEVSGSFSDTVADPRGEARRGEGGRRFAQRAVHQSAVADRESRADRQGGAIRRPHPHGAHRPRGGTGHRHGDDPRPRTVAGRSRRRRPIRLPAASCRSRRASRPTRCRRRPAASSRSAGRR